MIKQYVVTIVYPDSVAPATQAQVQSMLWDGLSELPRQDIHVREMSGAETEAYLKDHG